MSMPCMKTLWFAALLVALTMTGCARKPAEQQLREQVAALQASLQARDASSMQDALASDFVGTDGLDRAGARRLAQMVFLRHREVGVTLGPLAIDLDGDNAHARVRFTAALTGGEGALMPDAARVYDVDTAWRVEGGQWRAISVEWKPRL